ncbi:MAG: exonuclease domain-containing protein [Flavobacteriales bacterium]|nr:exonuclease domain-containing protein [Flavobacteriales bacterium]
MQLNLKRPICFFDLETTGTDVSKDKIVEISVVKVFPNGNKEVKTWLVNPGMHIPDASSAIHGITDEKVKNEPTFDKIAPLVDAMLRDSDLGGYNSNRYDIPLLAEEMLRVGMDFDMKNRVSVDVQTIFHKKEQRTLSAAYKFYCGADLEGAHGAQADTMATYEVLCAQLDKYGDLPNDMNALAEYTTQKKTADYAGFLAFDAEGFEVINFGKHRGRRVIDMWEHEPGYLGWMLSNDFPLYTKRVIENIRLRSLTNKNKI